MYRRTDVVFMNVGNIPVKVLHASMFGLMDEHCKGFISNKFYRWESLGEFCKLNHSCKGNNNGLNLIQW